MKNIGLKIEGMIVHVAANSETAALLITGVFWLIRHLCRHAHFEGFSGDIYSLAFDSGL